MVLTGRLSFLNKKKFSLAKDKRTLNKRYDYYGTATETFISVHQSLRGGDLYIYTRDVF